MMLWWKRRQQARERDEIFAFAQEEDIDGVLALVILDHVRTLPPHEQRDLFEWTQKHGKPQTLDDLADTPQVVQDFYSTLLDPPREP